MKFDDLVHLVHALPLFHSGLLLAGEVDPADLQRQLVRWTAAGRVIQLRRGLYTLAPPYRQTPPEPFLIANELIAPSYVSCQSALAFHGLIPEGVPAVVSVTTRRTAEVATPLGSFRYRHIKKAMFCGYQRVRLAAGQSAFVAAPEKALLDLTYLEPGADQQDFIEGLRLQNLSSLDRARLRHTAEASGSPKLCRAAARIARLAESEEQELQSL